LLTLRQENNGQGAMEPKFTEVEDSKLFFYLQQHANKELWSKCVLAILAQDFRKVDAQKMFSWMFLQDTLFFVDTINLYANCGDEVFHSLPWSEIELVIE